MEQLQWIIENSSAIKHEIKGFYKLQNYRYLHSLKCEMDAWVKEYFKCGEDPYDYDESDDMKSYIIDFNPNGSIKHLERL